MAILDGTVFCTEDNTMCVNTLGSADCVCVGGYELSDGECKRKNFTQRRTIVTAANCY